MGGNAHFAHIANQSVNVHQNKRKMPCNSCTVPGCTGFPCRQNTDIPPANLTQNDLQRGGWNALPDQAEIDRLTENAKHAVETVNGWPPPGFGKFGRK